MEEVDGIIISALKDLGCEYEEDLNNLADFSADMLVSASIRCLKIIIPDFDCPNTLPEAMSARYRMCTTLANAVQSLGYQGEIGYQTFLYSSVKEWRKLLMFLLEKLPKDNTQAADEAIGGGVMLSRLIANELSERMSLPWTPSYCSKQSIRWTTPSSWYIEGAAGLHGYHSTDVQAPSGTGDITKKLPKEVRLYYAQYMPYVVAQPPVKENVIASLLNKNANEVAAQQEWEAEWNRTGLASRLSEREYRAQKKQRLQKKLTEQFRSSNKESHAGAGIGLGADLQQVLNSFIDQYSSRHTKGSRFQHTEKLQFAKEDEALVAAQAATEQELQKQREDEINGLKEELSDLTSTIENLDLKIKKFSASIQQLHEDRLQQASRNKIEEDSYRVKKKTFDLLPNADENIAKLEELVGTSRERLKKLATKWEEVREPLVQQYRQLKMKNEASESATQLLLDEIRLLRERMKAVADDTKLKDELYKQLVKEYEHMTKDTSRSAYTRRIMEILVNIQKQKEDIGKILGDTRLVQKEINQLSGKLERVFTVTDEQVFKDAKKDEARRTSYKLLASIRENCGKVVEAIKETGQIKREQRDLEEQIDRETGKKVTANLERITADYQQMKKENSQLEAQLKAAH